MKWWANDSIDPYINDNNGQYGQTIVNDFGIIDDCSDGGNYIGVIVIVIVPIVIHCGSVLLPLPFPIPILPIPLLVVGGIDCYYLEVLTFCYYITLFCRTRMRTLVDDLPVLPGDDDQWPIVVHYLGWWYCHYRLFQVIIMIMKTQPIQLMKWWRTIINDNIENENWRYENIGYEANEMI